MANKKNTEQLENARLKLKNAKAIFFVDYQGLTHKQLEEARSLLRETDSEISIIKNTLLNLALKEKKHDVSNKLHGPFATLISYSDPVKTAKVLYTFFKKYSMPKIKFGIFEDEVIDEQMVISLANVSSREDSLAKLVGLLKSPLSNLVYSLDFNLSKLVFALKEVEKKKGISN